MAKKFIMVNKMLDDWRVTHTSLFTRKR